MSTHKNFNMTWTNKSIKALKKDLTMIGFEILCGKHDISYDFMYMCDRYVSDETQKAYEVYVNSY